MRTKSENVGNKQLRMRFTVEIVLPKAPSGNAIDDRIGCLLALYCEYLTQGLKDSIYPGRPITSLVVLSASAQEEEGA